MIILPDLFSPYIKGREAAIAANWNDQAQYNNVVGGYLKNERDDFLNRKAQDLFPLEYDQAWRNDQLSRDLFGYQQAAVNKYGGPYYDQQGQLAVQGQQAAAGQLALDQQQRALYSQMINDPQFINMMLNMYRQRLGGDQPTQQSDWGFSQ
ncbi:MAG: hypothetical protein LBV21_01140 [Candidatus Adiutrix sp.]|jgi:hypothetical protein|nr:hypothetical protein [Candidatus Adiutrix sp.]